MQTVHMSDGCAIKLKILGDSPGKPLAIAHHGAPGLSTHALAAAQFGFIQDEFRVLVFDSRGSGQSDKKGPYTHARWIEDVEELRRWANAEHFLMLGASHGGYLTLEYVVTYPHRLIGAVVGSAAPSWNHAAAMNAIATVVADPRYQSSDPYQVVRQFSGTLKNEKDVMEAWNASLPMYALSPEAGEPEVDVVTLFSEDEALVPVLDTVNAAQAALLSFDVRERLLRVQVPAMVYVGRYDKWYPVTLSEQIVARLRGAKLIVYEKSGHLPAFQEKSKFEKDCRDWIRQLEFSRVRKPETVEVETIS